VTLNAWGSGPLRPISFTRVAPERAEAVNRRRLLAPHLPISVAIVMATTRSPRHGRRASADAPDWGTRPEAAVQGDGPG